MELRLEGGLVVVVNCKSSSHTLCDYISHTWFCLYLHCANHDSWLKFYNTLNIKQCNCHLVTFQHKCTSKPLLYYTIWIFCVLGLLLCELEIEIPKSRVQTIVCHFCLMFKCQEWKLSMQNPCFNILTKSP